MSPSKLIFVTGASGFLGSHIVSQLLEKGYHVRAAARGSIIEELKSSYASWGDAFETVSITDITTSQFPDTLNGIYAVIHSAAPIPERADPKAILDGAIDGTLNVVQQAERAGVKRIIVTSSVASVRNPQGSFTDKDWNPVTKDQILNLKDKLEVYRGAKTVAERELWAFADAHPHVDITTINPPFFYGSLAPGFLLPTPNYYALSTNLYIYRLLSKDGAYPGGPFYVDVRDAAAAHVLALSAPLSTEPGIGRKRLIIASIYPFDFAGTRGLIAEKRYELTERLTGTTPPEFPLSQMPFDVERLDQVLGMQRSDFKTFETTILDAVDSLVELEKEWIDKGFTIQIPKI